MSARSVSLQQVARACERDDAEIQTDLDIRKSWSIFRTEIHMCNGIHDACLAFSASTSRS